MVIVGGVSFWSDFHFVDRPGHPASYPGIAEDFARTFRLLQSLPCDIFLDAAGYKEFVAKGQAAFETALKNEREAARAPSGY